MWVPSVRLGLLSVGGTPGALVLSQWSSRWSSSDVTSPCSHVYYVNIILGCQQSSWRLKNDPSLHE